MHTPVDVNYTMYIIFLCCFASPDLKCNPQPSESMGHLIVISVGVDSLYQFEVVCSVLLL